MNYQAQPLQPHEIDAMKANQETINLFVKSYELMLDFYGMKLESVETGLVARVEPEEKWTQRYNNLRRTSLKYFKPTQILTKAPYGQAPRTTISVLHEY